MATKQWKPRMIKASDVRRAEGLPEQRQAPKRHVCTDACPKPHGFCFKAYFQARRDQRGGFMLTDEKTRKRNRSGYRSRRKA